MSTITSPRIFLIAAAVLAAIPAASALLTTGLSAAPSSSPLFFGGSRPSHHRPSFIKLDAQQQPFSELDTLKAKRLSLRRRLPEPEAEVAAAVVENHDDIMPTRVVTPDLEYLYETGKERHSDDLFHIILMPSTFSKDNQMSLEYATESCTQILGIPSDKAHDLSLFAKHQGFSCLGTWTRGECLSLGEELLSRDLDCRVIPFNGGDGAVVPESRLPEIISAAAAAAVDVVPAAPKKAFVEDTYLLSCSS